MFAKIYFEDFTAEYWLPIIRIDIIRYMYLFLNGENWMKDVEDLKLKAEIDEIMNSVDSIMQNVETVIPAPQEESQAPSE